MLCLDLAVSIFLFVFKDVFCFSEGRPGVFRQGGIFQRKM